MKYIRLEMAVYCEAPSSATLQEVEDSILDSVQKDGVQAMISKAEIIRDEPEFED